MNRFLALALVALLWAGIYLPGLGSTELKGEEGRRILPAITMLETGNWIVPYVGGKPFLRKPPLVNWAIAASFRLTGVRNEWTARLPSALCVLAMGCALAALGSRDPRSFLSPEAAFVAAIMAMTSFGLLAKARFAGAEIEGIYVPLCGLAMACWLVWWCERRSAWLVWIVPLALLGVASLAKSPLHLLFFYALAMAVLWRTGELRELRRAPHLVGASIMVAIFALWAVPYFLMTKGAAEVWKDQFAGRVTENVFSWSSWLLNVPRGLADQLPWVLFAPVMATWRSRLAGRERALADGAFLALGGCFFGMLLVPGVLTRYVLPLGIPCCVLAARALCAEANTGRALRAWHRTHIALAWTLLAAALLAPLAAGLRWEAAVSLAQALRGIDLTAAVKVACFSTMIIAMCVAVVVRRATQLQPGALAATSGALLACAALLYATVAVRWIARADDLRPLAARIDAAIPAGKQLVLYDPGYQPAIFYLHAPYRYAAEMDEVPPDAEFLLLREKKAREKLESRWPDARIILQWRGKDGKGWQLLQLPPRA